MDARAVGLRLRQIREEILRLSVDDLAERVGSNRTSVYEFERGTRRPDWELLARLVEMAGVSWNWLLTGEEAAGVAEEDATYGREPVDPNLLSRAIEAVESSFEIADVKVDAPHRARAIAKAYEVLISKKEEPQPKQGRATGRT